MWQTIKERLDRPWKRIAFIFWAPLFAFTAIVVGYAIVHIYFVYTDRDGWVLGCHQQFIKLPDPWQINPDPVMFNAYERATHRFDARTRWIERRPEFIACMRATPVGSYWLNYWYVTLNAALFSFWMLLLGSFLFARFWRTGYTALKDWVAMR